MSKNRHCPYFRHCWDDCSDCEHSIRYNKLHGKVRRRDKKIEKLENELEEMVCKLECLLCHGTGGKLSKSSYPLKTMETAVTDYVQDCCDEDRKEAVRAFAGELCAGRVENDPVVTAVKSLAKEWGVLT